MVPEMVNFDTPLVKQPAPEKAKEEVRLSKQMNDWRYYEVDGPMGETATSPRKKKPVKP